MVERGQREFENHDEETPRSIFSALWFRALVVVLVLGVVAAVAVPYALDVMTAPTAKRAVAVRPPAASPPPSIPRPAAPARQDAPLTQDVAPPASAPPPAAPAARAIEPSKESPKPEPPPTVATADGPRMPPARPEAARAAEAPKLGKPAEASDPTKVAATPPPARETPRPAAGVTAGAPYWVQVGAFKDEATAKRLVDKLREQNFAVDHSVRTRSAAAPVVATGGDRYNVFVSGMAPSELNAKLGGKGLATQAVAGGVVITPSMPLREAVALSKDLAGDGLRIQVRRMTPTGGGGSPSASPAGAGDSLHRVRVGGFADKAAAEAAARELQSKGYKVYIARGNQ